MEIHAAIVHMTMNIAYGFKKTWKLHNVSPYQDILSAVFIV